MDAESKPKIPARLGNAAKGQWELTNAPSKSYDENSPRTNPRNNSVGIATLLAAQVLRALPRVRISRAVGRLCEKPLPPVVSRAVTSAYSRAYRVDLEESEQPRFVRKLRRILHSALSPGAHVSTDALVIPRGNYSQVDRRRRPLFVHCHRTTWSVCWMHAMPRATPGGVRVVSSRPATTPGISVAGDIPRHRAAQRSISGQSTGESRAAAFSHPRVAIVIDRRGRPRVRFWLMVGAVCRACGQRSADHLTYCPGSPDLASAHVARGRIGVFISAPGALLEPGFRARAGGTSVR